MYVTEILVPAMMDLSWQRSFLTLEQLKKGVDGYRASGGTLI
jgi:hypothetical protein